MPHIPMSDNIIESLVKDKLSQVSSFEVERFFNSENPVKDSLLLKIKDL